MYYICDNQRLGNAGKFQDSDRSQNHSRFNAGSLNMFHAIEGQNVIRLQAIEGPNAHEHMAFYAFHNI